MDGRTGEFQNTETLCLEQRMYFDRCMDFHASMMEKYGGELELPPLKSRTVGTQPHNERSDAA